jgi:hypothetical protein
MADYCYDCYERLFGDGADNDLRGLCKPGEMVHVLCEGCGGILVDHNGRKVNCPPEEDASKPKEYRMPIIEKDDDYPNATITSYKKIPDEIVAAISQAAREETLNKILIKMKPWQDIETKRWYLPTLKEVKEYCESLQQPKQERNS